MIRLGGCGDGVRVPTTSFKTSRYYHGDVPVQFNLEGKFSGTKNCPMVVGDHITYSAC